MPLIHQGLRAGPVLGRRSARQIARLPQLDGMRAAAVGAVVVFHARGSTLPGGYIGVDLFFVLSGFLITGILVREFEKRGRLDFTRFYVNRALRLLPALVTVCAAVAIALLFLPDAAERTATYRGVLTALTYTSSPVAAIDPTSLGWMLPTWSLSVEEYYYLFWPLLLLLALRSKRPALWVGAGVVVACAYRLLAAVFTDWTMQRLSYGADTRAEQLMIGAGLALLIGKLRVPRAVGPAAAAFLVLFMFVPNGWSAEFYRFGGSTVVATASAALVAATVIRPASLLSRLCSLRPLCWIGCRSYGIYLWNIPLIGLVGASPLPVALHLPVNLVLSLAIPALSYRFVEQPVLRLKSRFRTDAEQPLPLSDGTPGPADCS